ncbi:MAG: M67 family metallopeptidase [Mariprofundaceae bacterium]
MQATFTPDIHIPEPERFRSQAYLDVLDANNTHQLCRIGNDAINSMHASASRHYPLEACGLLIGKMNTQGWCIDEAREVANLNEERAADRFILDPQAYQTADRELAGSGREIIGIYHSHPDCPAKPSPTDLAAAWEGFAYIIVSTCNGQAADTRCWALNESGNRFLAVHMQDLAAKGD